MLTRDYILRMIDVLSRALAKILFLKDGNNFKEALHELNMATKELIGMDRIFIHSVSDSQLVTLMEPEENLLSPKCYLLGIVFKEEAEISKQQGNEEEYIDFNMRSLYMFVEGIERSKVMIEKDHLKKIDEVIDKLNNYELPEDIKGKLFYYYEYTGKFDKAEDVLFSLVDEDNSYLNKGIDFYERLLKKNDTELEKGNLPRIEVEESLKDLLNKKSN